MFFHATLTIDYIVKRMWHLCSLTVHFVREKKSRHLTQLVTKKTFIGSFPQFWRMRRFLPCLSLMEGTLSIYALWVRAAQLKRWCTAEKQPAMTFNWHSPTAQRQRWLTCRAPPRLCCRSVRKFPSFTVTFSLKHKASSLLKECLGGYVELNILGAGIHRSPPRCFLKHCKHNSDRFLDLWESCLRFVGRNSRCQ